MLTLHFSSFSGIRPSTTFGITTDSADSKMYVNISFRQLWIFFHWNPFFFLSLLFLFLSLFSKSSIYVLFCFWRCFFLSSILLRVSSPFVRLMSCYTSGRFFLIIFTQWNNSRIFLMVFLSHVIDNTLHQLMFHRNVE